MLLTDNRLVERIDRQQILTTLGYSTEATIPARISSLVNEYTQDSNHFIDLSYSYVIRDIHTVEWNHTTIEGGVIFRSRILAQLLEQCESVAIFTLTIGNRLERIAARLAENGLVLRALILDAIGSDAAEKAANLVHAEISEKVSIFGLYTSRRFSPGYCDWDVSQQEIIFSAMNGDSAGVHLTDGCLMLPRKSVSGIIGIGKRDSNIENYNPCITCAKRDCIGRRV